MRRNAARATLTCTKLGSSLSGKEIYAPRSRRVAQAKGGGYGRKKCLLGKVMQEVTVIHRIQMQVTSGSQKAPPERQPRRDIHIYIDSPVCGTWSVRPMFFAGVHTAKPKATAAPKIIKKPRRKKYLSATLFLSFRLEVIKVDETFIAGPPPCLWPPRPSVTKAETSAKTKVCARSCHNITSVR